jgi:hypothetical protein
MTDEFTVAFVSQGRLFLKAADGEAREISCQFVERANERARRDGDRHGWKSRRESGPSLMSSQLLWRTAQSGEISQIQITSASPGKSGEILFTLNTSSVGGLFAHELRDQSERRLYHKNGFRGRHLCKHPSEDLVALSVSSGNLESHIAITDTEGRNLREVTEGDSSDECPCWTPGGKRQLVFQSAGVGRNSQGFPVGLGPYRIERLDLDGGEMTTLLEDEKFDCLNPRVQEDGKLLFIRRPYSAGAEPVSWSAMITDTLFFPFRLLRAVIHFFNFFSVTFSGKPLLTSGGPGGQPQNATTMLLWGKIIDAEKAMKSMKSGGSTAIVPANWRLVRRDVATREEETLANSVGSFDLLPGGAIVYTDGASIFRLEGSGKKEKSAICERKLVESIHCWRVWNWEIECS